ncbi:MAG TPA: cellulase family glycosylhydrolase [Anaerolineaceae bacterium]|nr:cellulase family glycosylhydrolase [Anaerolineaceae bacterium]HPN53142.1 cellulase family glycosylhydrolase [Anaerolineaceae bacterium]
MTWYGFNFQWMFSWQGQPPEPPDEKALDFLSACGFNFVRLTTDYRFWTPLLPGGPDYFHPDETVLAYLDRYVAACRSRGLHLCLNLHRAPGYCINRNDLETHNLWVDDLPQQAFIYIWQVLARRFSGLPGEDLSFDLVNEPPEIGQYGLTRENHASLIRRTTAAIRAVDPGRPIIIDGLGGGNLAMPELADLGLIHSTRGYQPMTVSHYQAEWWSGSQGMPAPVYPGCHWEGKSWDRDAIRGFYQPWRDVESQGVPVHIGEFGCYNKTPNAVALKWFKDLFAVFQEFSWGYAMWNFAGPFGIIGHGRPGARFEPFQGYAVDRDLLDLFLEHRV